MIIECSKEYVGFGVGIVNRYTRNRALHMKDTLLGLMSAVKHMHSNPSLKYRHNAHSIIAQAYTAGIRVFDTARIYGFSEYELGLALKQIPRDEVFICTKVSDMDLTREGGAPTVRGNLEKSLSDLGTKNVDLYLLHWPVGNWVKMYSEMDELYKEGLTKAIGVCNFTVGNFKELEQHPELTQPQFCQIECHPLYSNREVVAYCENHGIRILAHTPTGRMLADTRNDGVLNIIAREQNRTVAQIILRWHVQHNRLPITHTKNPAHIEENASIFDFLLTDEQMKRIDSLDSGKKLFKTIGIDNPNYKYNK